MSKLKCDFEDFNSKVQTISNLITSYDNLYKKLINLSNESSIFWKSYAEQVFIKKLLLRKNELENLSYKMNEINSFLKEVISSYQNIEGKYS